jgi:hypothetical protein
MMRRMAFLPPGSMTPPFRCRQALGEAVTQDGGALSALQEISNVFRATYPVLLFFVAVIGATERIVSLVG